MIVKIAPRVIYVPREDWRANVDLERLGWIVPRDQRYECITHHSVVIDDDATPDLWTDLPEVFGKQRQLQRLRPDLGLDVPYQEVGYYMEPGFKWEGQPIDIVLCQGRGLDRGGAHTAGRNDQGDWHNHVAIATCIEGNFEDDAPNLRRFREPMSHVWGWYKYEKGLKNLCA